MLQLIVKKNFFLTMCSLIFFLTTFNNKSNLSFFFFTIKTINFNQTKLVEESIKSELINFLTKQSLFFFDKNKTINLLKRSAWVDKIHVKSKFPDEVKIHITEFYPVAYFEKDSQIFILNNGYLVSLYNENISLPSLIKLKDIKNIDNLIKFLKNLKVYDNFFSLISEIHYIYDDRWDVILNNGVLVKLVNSSLEDQIKKIEIFIKDKDIKIIDLRINNYITVQ